MNRMDIIRCPLYTKGMELIAENDVTGTPVTIRISKQGGLKTQYVVEEFAHGKRLGWSILGSEAEAKRDANARWTSARHRLTGTLSGTYWVMNGIEWKIIAGKRGNYVKVWTRGAWTYAEGMLSEVLSRGERVVDQLLIDELDNR